MGANKPLKKLVNADKPTALQSPSDSVARTNSKWAQTTSLQGLYEVILYATVL